jgi:hypothetical protein
MTNTRKTPAAATPAAEVDTKPVPEATETPEAAEETVTVVGPPLRPGQQAEKITLAHHLRIGMDEYRPGQSALVSPDYARQLRRNGYIARG